MKLLRFAALLLYGLLIIPPSLRADGYSSFEQHDAAVSVMLKDAGLPQVFKYLPLLLTDCDDSYRDSYTSGAWAISIPLAHSSGLVVTSGYDQRRDFDIATEVATAYLKKLYTSFDGDTVKTLSQYCASAHRNEFADSGRFALNRLYAVGIEYESYHGTPDIMLSKVILDAPVYMDELCDALGLDYIMMRSWNPALVPFTDLIPKGAVIDIPEESVRGFDNLKSVLYSSAQVRRIVASNPSKRKESAVQATVDSLNRRVTVKSQSSSSQSYSVYKVRKGDTLSKIAVRHHTTVAKIKKWNRLSSDKIREGQRLKIYK